MYPLDEICQKDKRDRLATIVSDHLAAGANALRKEEINVLNSMLETSLPDLRKETIQLITRKLAGSTATSNKLAMTLANGPVSIAAPILEKSPVLGQGDLLKLARVKSQGHLLAISKRDLLDRDLTRELLRRGNREVRRMVICNLGADISPEDFERYAALIPVKMGRRIGHLRKSNDRLVHDLLKSDKDIVVGPELEERQASIPVEDWIRTLRGGKAVIDRAIAQLGMEKNLRGIVQLLAAMSGLPEKQVMHLMVRFDATGLAMVCRSLAVSPMEYSALSRLRCSHIRLPASTKCLWTANYNVLEVVDARRFLSLLSYKIKFQNAEDRRSRLAETGSVDGGVEINCMPGTRQAPAPAPTSSISP